MRRSASRQGLTGSLFREFAFTLAGAVIISGIVAVTLSPMMSSKLLKPHGAQGRFAAFVDRTFTRLENWYARRLTGSLDYRGVTLVIVARSPWHHGVPVHEDVLRACAGRGSGRLSRHRQHAEIRDRRLHAGLLQAGFTNAGEKIPEIDDSFLIVGIDGGGGGFFGFKLKEWSEREKKGRRDQAGDPEPPERECRRAGLRLRAAVSARCAATACRSSTCCAPSAIRPRPMRWPSRFASSATEVRQVHRRAELDLLRDAAGPHHRGSRPGRRARRAGLARSAPRSALSSAARRSRSSTATTAATTWSARSGSKTA